MKIFQICHTWDLSDPKLHPQNVTENYQYLQHELPGLDAFPHGPLIAVLGELWRVVIGVLDPDHHVGRGIEWRLTLVCAHDTDVVGVSMLPVNGALQDDLVAFVGNRRHAEHLDTVRQVVG